MRILPTDTFLFPKASLLKHLLWILIPLANLVNTHGSLLHTEQGNAIKTDVSFWQGHVRVPLVRESKADS
jgi:hypothetical protein